MEMEYNMATEDKVDEQFTSAVTRLYHLKQVRPKQAEIVARNAMKNIAAVMGYEMVFPEN